MRTKPFMQYCFLLFSKNDSSKNFDSQFPHFYDANKQIKKMEIGHFIKNQYNFQNSKNKIFLQRDTQFIEFFSYLKTIPIMTQI